MALDYLIICLLLFSSLFRAYEASNGDSDPLYRVCVEQCEVTGCAGERCFSHCKLSSNASSVIDGPWYMQKPFYLQLKQWYCQSECQHQCMAEREKEKALLGLGPVKYNGKWPFQQFYCFQEPVSVAFSVLNLALHYHGWDKFLFHVNYKLPQRRDNTPFYDYRGLWTIYALLSMSSCFWTAVYHSRDMYLTRILECSSGVALLGFSLTLALIRSFDLRDDAARVMVAAPLLSFTATHILYLNNYQMDSDWNAKVCGAMAVAQLLIWALWAAIIRPPAAMKLWVAVIGFGLRLLLQMLDFPPYNGLIDACALWHASAAPLIYIWWSFVKDDAQCITLTLIKKTK
ncbi:uncharacterized protein LOC127254508 [Andrographis paniculata]|uniref:uncharacterized protein LOC127254508 n=1 Tax=Andrographis paniculata TaxID=175694 RepID=UPI0021E7BEFF|nr:uncharacterized protein LOC127254508 [Andrographis paniculata]